MEFFLLLVLVGFLLYYIFEGPGLTAGSWGVLDIVGLLVILGVLFYLGKKSLGHFRRSSR